MLTPLRRAMVPCAVAALLAAVFVAPAAALAPSNDDFANATVVTAVPFTDAVDTAEATQAPDDPSCAGAGPTVWYAYTPPTSGAVLANTFGSNYDTTLSVYSGTRGALSRLACNDDFNGLQSRVQVTLSAGTAYWFMVGAFSGGPGGQLRFAVEALPPPPANDELATATVIESLPFSDTVDTRGSTRRDDDPSCAAAGSTVWYAYTPTAPGIVRVNSSGSSYATNLSAYTGALPGLTSLGCASWSDPLRFDVVPGTTYYILVGAMTPGGGTLRLNVELLPPRAGIGNSLGDGSGQSLCPAGTAVTGVRAGLFSSWWGTFVGDVVAICDATTPAPSAIGNASHRLSTCPAGQFATALSGRGGDLVDAVRVHCQAVDRDDRPVGPVTEGFLAGASGGSPQGPITCPEGEVLVGLAGTFRVGFHDLLDFVRPVCGVLNRPYGFGGFAPPVSSTSVNAANAGRTIPVSYRITHPDGSPVTDPASFRSLTSAPTDASCAPGAPAEPAYEHTAGSSGLQYVGDGVWRLNWKTRKAYAGQCRTLSLTLADGRTHTAAFSFF